MPDVGFKETFRDTPDVKWTRITEEYEPDKLGVCINLANVAPSQYGDYNFNSMVKFKGKFIGASKEGLFELTGDLDNDRNINAFVELPNSDYGFIWTRIGHDDT